MLPTIRMTRGSGAASLLLWLTWAAAAVTPHLVQAAEACCRDCGQVAVCRKVCRLVCEEKTVEVTCWGCRQEDFCRPLPSRRGERHCETVCPACSMGAPRPRGDCCPASSADTCGGACGEGHAADVCSRPKWLVWFDWCPRGARIHTKTKLMKKVVEKKIPTYRYVVEDVCQSCISHRAGMTADE